ncbi:MAG: acetyl-CoA carboxylase biotin carboxyl carrier protein [Parvularculales bacterium]
MTKNSKDSANEHFIRNLINLLTESELSELEVETEDMRVRVARNTAPSIPVAMAATPVASPVASNDKVNKEDGTPAGEAGETVTSPIVGTIFVAPEPGAPPFVQIGAEVAEGQTLFIIEAMKTMNHIPAPRSGKVVKILITDGQPVEYGEPLCVMN